MGRAGFRGVRGEGVDKGGSGGQGVSAGFWGGGAGRQGQIQGGPWGSGFFCVEMTWNDPNVLCT